LLLTFKVKHGRDFSQELAKARKIAEFAVRTRSRSSRDVKHLGLKSAIANQILRKYSCDRKAKKVNKIVLTVPGQSIRTDKAQRTIKVSCLKLELQYRFRNDFEKINQIELDGQYAYIIVSVPELKPIETGQFIGVDRNTTGHCVVVANPQTGKVWKLGKSAEHVHKKYKTIRRTLQKKGKFRKLKTTKRRETRKIRDLNHKISRKIVQIATANGCGIKMEDLEGIRENRKHARSFQYSLNSWSFYQLQQMIEYKARLQRIPVAYVDPAHTSQKCSRCGHIGDRNGKEFKCPSCGHVEHADTNASFNISTALAIQMGATRLHADRDACKGNTDTPQGATPMNDGDPRTPWL
jgi:putative transposase